MSKRVTQKIALQVSGRFALFTDVDTSSDPRSLLVPTATALRGLCKSILHKNNLLIIPEKVEFLPYTDPVTGKKIETVETTPYSTYRIDMTKFKGHWFGSPVGTTLLYGVHYRVHYHVEGYSCHIEELQRRIRVNDWDNPPYLGVRECIADIRPVDNTPVLSGLTILGEHMRESCGGKEIVVEVRKGEMKYPDSVETAFRLIFNQRWKGDR